MVVLDSTVVNIALPSAQADLGFSDANRQWIITAYALAFGSLLLFGGRLADVMGRKRVLIIGLVGFSVASAIGGLAPNFEVLVTARALQGIFGALLTPAALSTLTTTFTDPDERGKAFGIYLLVNQRPDGKAQLDLAAPYAYSFRRRAARSAVSNRSISRRSDSLRLPRPYVVTMRSSRGKSVSETENATDVALRAMLTSL